MWSSYIFNCTEGKYVLNSDKTGLYKITSNYIGVFGVLIMCYTKANKITVLKIITKHSIPQTIKVLNTISIDFISKELSSASINECFKYYNRLHVVFISAFMDM